MDAYRHTSLPRNQVPEWAASYINYKGLKKLVKAAAVIVKNGEPVDLAGGRTSSELSTGAQPVP
jgi:SPX domain protein involved in polyphosphate accumulation